MLAILFALFLAAASALKITSPESGTNIPYNFPLTVFFDTEGAVLSNFTVSFNGVIVCQMDAVSGSGSCTAKANKTIRGSMQILAHGVDLNATRVSSLVTVQIYPLQQSALPTAEPEVTIDNIWEPSYPSMNTVNVNAVAMDYQLHKKRM